MADLNVMKSKSFKDNLTAILAEGPGSGASAIDKNLLAYTKYLATMLGKLISENESQTAEYKETIKNLRDQNHELAAKVSSLEVKSTTSSYASMTKENLPTETISMIADVAVQQAKKAKAIEKNIVISGIKPHHSKKPADIESNDITKVDDVLSELNLDRTHVAKQTRLKTKLKDIIIVEFTDIMSKNTAVSNAKNLRKSRGFTNIYVNEDKSPEERYADRDRRIKCKELNATECTQQDEQGRPYGTDGEKRFFYMVRDGKVIKFSFSPKS